jgi:hypothetical protein
MAGFELGFEVSGNWRVEVNELGIEGKGIFYEVEELIRIYFFLEDFK